MSLIERIANWLADLITGDMDDNRPTSEDVMESCRGSEYDEQSLDGPFRGED